MSSKFLSKNCLQGSAALLSMFMIGVVAQPTKAINVSLTTDPATLQSALFAGTTGLTITGFTVDGNQSGNAISTGVYTNTAGTYGIGSGIILSSGNAANYETGPNTSGSRTTGFGASQTPAQQALLQPISGRSNHFDVTEISVNFDTNIGFNQIAFDVVFGSEEFAEFVNSSFIDAFGLYVNGQNIAFVDALPVNINHPDFAPIPGTELDGVIAPSGNPVLSFVASVPTNSTNNNLTFIIADTSDGSYDSTTYISSLSLVGGSQDNPFLPATTQAALALCENPTTLQSGVFFFCNVPSGAWFDPPTVFGYTYNINSTGDLFTNILNFPTGFSNPFTVTANNVNLGSFTPGQSVDFVNLLGAGVTSFTVTGLNPLVELNDPLGFPLQLAFNNTLVDFSMTALQGPVVDPVTAPEPSSLLGLAFIGGLGVSRFFKRVQKNNASKEAQTTQSR